MANRAEIKNIIAQEVLKCSKDPVYFFKKYCYIQHPDRGKILFNTYAFQDKVLDLFKRKEDIITLKSRQLGISTLAAGYALWLMIFHKDKNILVLATDQATAKNLVTKVQYMYDHLPKYLKLKSKEYNKLTLKLINGSRIKAASSTSSAARSEAVSLLIIDEAAFIDNIEATFASAQQTLATGGQSLILSTPNGVGNWFHQTWERAETRENGFVPVKLPWYVHPERDQTWRDQQDAEIGPRLAAQECDCDFLSSGDTVFEGEDMTFYEETFVREPLERRFVDGNYWVWEGPQTGKDYMVVADVARGDGKDSSTFHVFDIEEAKQVSEYKGKLPPRLFGDVLVAEATAYNDALLVVENIGIGWATIEQILEREYKNLYYSSKNNQETVEAYMNKFENDKLVPGFTVSTTTRPLLVAKAREYVGDRSVKIYSQRLLKEMRVFVWNNGKPAAQAGYNDDLVMAFATALYVRDTALKMRQQGMDLVRAQLSSFSSLNKRNPAVMTTRSFHTQQPYKMNTAYGQEDFSWVVR